MGKFNTNSEMIIEIDEAISTEYINHDCDRKQRTMVYIWDEKGQWFTEFL
jgi:hypothetical protein